MKRNWHFILGTLPILAAWGYLDSPKKITWEINNPNLIAGYRPEKFGNPEMVVENKDSALHFNGINDGLIMPTIPLEGWSAFTMEVLFKPDSDGPIAPRFIHFEDTLLNRGTFEIRLNSKGQWYFDGFLKTGKTNKGLTLIDSTKLHAADQWYWAAIVYDGKNMYSYINGIKELEGTLDFPPMTKGKLAIGLRLNKVNWFKGQIREIRFHHAVLAPEELQHK